MTTILEFSDTFVLASEIVLMSIETDDRGESYINAQLKNGKNVFVARIPSSSYNDRCIFLKKWADLWKDAVGK